MVFVDVLDGDVWNGIGLEVFFDGVCFIADGENDVCDVMSGEVFNDMLHGWLIFDWEKGFWEGVGEGSKTGAEAADEDEGGCDWLLRGIHKERAFVWFLKGCGNGFIL